MNDEMKALATRAVACRHWRWMPGMRAIDSAGKDRNALIIDTEGAIIYEDDRGVLLEAYASRTDIPDLTDAATLGCLLALVRDAWGADVVVGWHFADAETRAERIWFVDDPDDDSLANGLPYILSDSEGPTRAHALVRALELSQ